MSLSVHFSRELVQTLSIRQTHELPFIFSCEAVLQVLLIRKHEQRDVPARYEWLRKLGDLPRYVLLLSDGVCVLQALLAYDLKGQIERGSIARFSLVRIRQLFAHFNTVEQKWVLIVTHALCEKVYDEMLGPPHKEVLTLPMPGTCAPAMEDTVMRDSGDPPLAEEIAVPEIAAPKASPVAGPSRQVSKPGIVSTALASPTADQPAQRKTPSLDVGGYSKLADLGVIYENSPPPLKAFCNILAMVVSVGECQDTKSQYGLIAKREIRLKDSSSSEPTRLALWRSDASGWACRAGVVIALKRAMVVKYKGFGLTFHSTNTELIPNPGGTEADTLKNLLHGHGPNTDTGAEVQHEPSPDRFPLPTVASVPASTISSIAQVKAAQYSPDVEPAPEFFVSVEGITCKSNKITIEVCTQCRKSLSQDATGGSWTCNTCTLRTKLPSHKFVVPFQASDMTGQATFVATDESGALIFGMSADDVQDIREQSADAWQDLLDALRARRLVLKCRVQWIKRGEQPQLRRFKVIHVEDLDKAAMAAHLRDYLQARP